FTYRANDGAANSNIATVTITITAQPPVAIDDTYTTVGNTELRVGLAPGLTPRVLATGDVLDNDTDPDTPNASLTVTAFDTTSANGGTVSMDAQGRFSYLPPAGNNGPDSFNYIVSDGLNTDTGTVHINFTERVWYVNQAYAGASTGRSSEPFTTLTAAQSASVSGDYIRVHAGSYGTGIALQFGQRLIGSGAPLIVGSFTLDGATVRPTIGGTITLGSNNLVTGLNVNAGGFGIAGSGVASGTIASVGVTSGSDGISLSAASGPFALTDVTIAATGGAGLIVNGGTPAVTAANLDVTTTGFVGVQTTGGSLTITAGSNGSTIASTNASAFSATNVPLNVTLLSANASNAANGIAFNNTSGSFSVTGTGAVAGTGGTISGMSARGVSATGAGSISLKNMIFLNNATTNGATAAVCADLIGGGNTGCNAAVHLVNVTGGTTLDNVSINGSNQVGINGNNVNGLTLNNVEVQNAGNELLESGVQFMNLTGTVAFTNANIHNNFFRQFDVRNNTGSLTMNVTGSTFASTAAGTGAQGFLGTFEGSAGATLNVQSSTFQNNFTSGFRTDAIGSSSLAVTVNNSTFQNNGGQVSLQQQNAANVTYTVSNNTMNVTSVVAVNLFKAVPSTGTLNGTLTGNTIGTVGVLGSGCAGCDAVFLNSTSGGSAAATITNNIIRQFGNRGIAAQGTVGTSTTNLNIKNNTITNPDAGAQNAIFVQSGTSSTDTTFVCADIASNTLGGVYAAGAIRVRNRFAGTNFRVPGYVGPGDATTVAAFISAQNAGAVTTATVSTNPFIGGAACPTP
ncbi:MAG TPA: Ig-like domain-containing protein, partial [Thermoanaerobaculia bacterium]|nr:Ig-like domain-containing protein [Thermoanaerobaculia bacterium]